MYQPPEKETIRQLFDSIAPRYDQLNDLFSGFLHKAWKRHLVAQVLKYPSNPKHILDVACGTGDLARLFKKKVPDASVRGIDLSPSMIQHAKKKTSSIDYSVANALTFDAQELDILTCSFGIRNMEDVGLFFRRTSLQLSDAGVCGILEFGAPPPNLFNQVYGRTLGKWIPRLGSHLSGHKEAYKYLVDSSLAFPSGLELVTWAERHGLKCISFGTHAFGLVHWYIFKKQIQVRPEMPPTEN